MGSTFGGVAYFDSGPQRFRMGRRGELARGPFVNPNSFPVTDTFGTDIELAVFQTGRLVNASAAALWAAVDTIAARAELFTAATLVDTYGRSYADMNMVTFTPEDIVDRGRVSSLEYTVLYLRLG